MGGANERLLVETTSNPLHEVTPKWILIAYGYGTCKIPSLFLLSLVFVWLQIRIFFSWFFPPKKKNYNSPHIVDLLFLYRNNITTTTTTSGGGLRRRWRQPWRHFDLSQLFFHWSRDARRCVIYLHGPVAFLFLVGGGAIWIYDRPNTRDFFFVRGWKRKRNFCQ